MRIDKAKLNNFVRALNADFAAPNGRRWILCRAESGVVGWRVRQIGGDLGSYETDIFYARDAGAAEAWFEGFIHAARLACAGAL